MAYIKLNFLSHIDNYFFYGIKNPKFQLLHLLLYHYYTLGVVVFDALVSQNMPITIPTTPTFPTSS